MKILKPDSVDVLFRLFKPDASGRLSLGMLKVFPLAVKEAERSEPLPAVWPLVKLALGKEPLDAGLPKARGEFLVYGSAYKPAALTSQPLLVEASVGEVSKRLAVFGDRQFNVMTGISAPKPFSRMPITPENAFGGEGFADNPLGKGFCEIPADPATGAAASWPVPNIETPERLLVQRGDSALPAGFWALAPDAPARASLLGRFDQHWEKNRWPHLPLDTAPDFFQVAPVDQRLSGYWRGDEKIVLRNLHPHSALLESALPGLRARCFVHRSGGEAANNFSEAAAHAETVWLFPEHDCGLILFRALAPVSDEDGDDVAHVFIELESLSGQPLPQAHYWQLFQEKIGLAKPAKVEPVAEAAAFQVAPLAVAPPAAPAVDVSLDALANSPAIAEIEKMTAEVDTQVKALMAQHGLTPADLEKYIANPGTSPAPMPLAEIEKSIAEVDAQMQQLMARHGIAPADLDRYMTPAASGSAGEAEEVGRLIAEAEKQVHELIGSSGLNVPEMKAALASHPGLAAAIDDFLTMGAKGASVDMAALMAQVAALAPKLAMPPPAAEPAPVEPVEAAPVRLDRQGVMARHAAGQSMAACDLSTIDLSQLDLRGADFSGALLSGASFAGSRVGGAKFTDALLQKADFSAAELDGASLVGASADGAKFVGSRMQKIDASKADFSGGDFSGADLSGATLAGTVFAGSRMAGLQAKACVADKASFEDCDLSGAVFGESRCNGARFNGADLQQANFAGASAEKAEFFGVNAANSSFAGAHLGASRANASSQFPDANFCGASLQMANWGGVALNRAVLSEAQLDKADLSRAQLDQASLLRASAKETRFDKASLDGADLSGINLFNGSLRLAKLGSARLQMANLYGVNFYGTLPTATCVLGSNIDKTLLRMK